MYGDARGGHITVHKAFDIEPKFIAIYRNEFYGMCFPYGCGYTEQEAVRKLWKALHD